MGDEFWNAVRAGPLRLHLFRRPGDRTLEEASFLSLASKSHSLSF
jgi:hypothetical protein